MLAIGKDANMQPQTVDMLCVAQMETLPVTSAMVQHETKTDPVLIKVHDIPMNEWTHAHKQLFPAFFT